MELILYKFESLPINSPVPSGYAGLSWAHFNVVNPAKTTQGYIPIAPASGSQVLSGSYTDIPYVTQGMGNSLLVTVNSFSFACAFAVGTAAFNAPAACSMMVIVKALTPVYSVMTYGPFVSNGALNQSVFQQSMTKVTGPFSGQYVHFAVTAGPGDAQLYMDDFQITNSYAGSSCTSLG